MSRVCGFYNSFGILPNGGLGTIKKKTSAKINPAISNLKSLAKPQIDIRISFAYAIIDIDISA